MYLFLDKDCFLNTLAKRIYDSDKMRDVCLELGMKSHHYLSHMSNNPNNINGAAFQALSTWYSKNEKRGKTIVEMFTCLKEVRFPSISRGKPFNMRHKRKAGDLVGDV